MGNLGLGGGFSREEFTSEADQLGDSESEVGQTDSIRISDGGKMVAWASIQPHNTLWAIKPNNVSSAVFWIFFPSFFFFKKKT